MSELLPGDGVHEFLEKFRNAKNFNSKELRLTIQEAEQLAIGISLMTSRYKQLSDQVIELQEQLLNVGNEDELTISGGKF